MSSYYISFLAFAALIVALIDKVMRGKKLASDIQNEMKCSITPLEYFDFRKVEPAKHRPFLSMGHVTMGKCS
jgi:hypothetical protein